MKIKFILSCTLIFTASLCSAQSLKDLIKNGNTKIGTMDFTGAEQDFANAIKVNNPVVTTYLDKLNKYNAMNEYQKSTSDMPDGFVYNHDNAVPYYGHGLALAGLGKQEEALTDFEKAITIDPKYGDALCERGIIYISKGTKDKGCMDLRKAKSFGSIKAKELYSQNACSGMSATFITSGNNKYDSKDYAGALADYSNAIQLNSDSAEAYIKRGQCNTALKKYDKAVSDFNKALKLQNSDTLTTLYYRGVAYLSAEKFNEAFKDFSVVLQANANNYDAALQRGYACEGMQNFKSAIYDYSEAIRIKPKDGMAYYRRGLLEQDFKDGSACKDFKLAAAYGNEDAKSMVDSCAPKPSK